MTVHQVICRWDFTLRPKLMDQPGALCDALGMATRWALVKEESSKRQFSLTATKAGHSSQNFTFTPELAVFSITWLDGVALAELEDHQDLKELFRCLDVVKEFGDVKDLRRSGLRLIHLDAISPQLDRPEGNVQVLVDQFLDRSCQDVASGVTKVAGRIEDASIKLVGKHKDQIGYTISYGPFADFEAPKFFGDVAEHWKPTQYDVLCDADFWEADFAMTSSARKWAAPLFKRFAGVVSSVTSGLKEKVNG